MTIRSKWKPVLLGFLVVLGIWAVGPVLGAEKPAPPPPPAPPPGPSPVQGGSPASDGEIVFETEALQKGEVAVNASGRPLPGQYQPVSFLVATDSVFLLDSKERTVACHSLADGKKVLSIQLEPGEKGSETLYSDLAMMPDGTLLVASARPQAIHFIKDGKLLRKMDIHTLVQYIDRFRTDDSGLIMVDDPIKGSRYVFDDKGTIVRTLPWEFLPIILPGKKVARSEIPEASQPPFPARITLFDLADIVKGTGTFTLSLEKLPLFVQVLGMTPAGELLVFVISGREGDVPEKGLAMRVDRDGKVVGSVEMPWKARSSTFRALNVRPDPEAPAGFSAFFAFTENGKFRISRFRIP